MCSIKSIERGIFLAVYRGVNGVNREIKQIFRGVNGVNRKIQQQYRGINGTNRIVFRDGYRLDEIAQVVFKVYHASAVSLNDTVTHTNLEMELVRLRTNGKDIVSYSFEIPKSQSTSAVPPCASIQLLGEYKIQFLDGSEYPFNSETLIKTLDITNMTMKYCMGSLVWGWSNEPEVTGKLQVLDQTCTTITEFTEINHAGLILKKLINYYNTYPQSSMVNLAVYAGSNNKRYPSSIDWFTNWVGETGLNHVFLQKEQYTYESDIAIVDARK